jgi:HK97 family phage major capsid protein
MSVSAALTGEVRMLKERKQALARTLEGHLAQAQRDGRQEMRANEKAMLGEVRQIETRIERAEAELHRAGDASAAIFGPGGQPGTGRAVNTAGQLAPLNFPEAEMRRMQTAATHGETCRIESTFENRDFSTADPLLPASLFPYPIAAQHEGRLLDFLPGYGIETPSVTFIRHVSTTGVPAITAEGGLKPEVIFNTDALTATAVKIAANNGLSWEIIQDWPAFQSYAGTELYKQIIDIENLELLQGDLTEPGSPPTEPYPGMTGFLATSGILTYDASADTGGSGSTLLSALDSVEKSIAALRVGAALAVPDLFVLHPNTWSALRRIKDGFGHFMVQPDPTTDQASELWGIPVLQTTQQLPGTGLLIDTQKFGYVAVRESLSMRIGYTGTDFTQNILRTVAEERLVLCVTRPPAILAISNLPTS